MLSRSLHSALVGVLLTLGLTLAPSSALADAGSSPAGASAVGAYLDLGAAHGCALQKDRVVRCWGKGSSGRLGGGQLDDRLSSAGAGEATTLSLGQVTAITAGDAHTCALLSVGTVRCWGQGGGGQLGTGNRDNRGDGAADPLSGTDDPSTVPLGAAATAISAGGEFTCALLSDGAVRCWGDGRYGAVGARGTDARLDGLADGPTDDASTVPLGGPATAISAGTQHACALLASGTVRCWGSGAEGRLGTGKTDDRLDGIVDSGSGTDEASTVPLAEPATAISAGGAHTCAILASGAVSCWGNNGFGQLGAGRTDARLDGVISGSGTGATDAATIVPIKPVGTAQNKLATTPSLRATSIAAGDLHTCAIVEGGDVRCWGQGTLGQLGQGATDHRLDASVNNIADVATRAGAGTAGTGAGLGAPAVGVTAGYAATCAELATGTVRCWGDGSDGRLGSRATDPRFDGVVTPATGTDDASLVPISGVPSVFGDLFAEPSPPPPASAGPLATTPPLLATPIAIPALSFKLSIKSKKATIAALLAPTKAGTCPKTVGVTVKEGKTKLGTAKLKVSKKSPNCRVSGTVKLKRAVKKGKTVTVSVSGKGVTARTLTPTR